MHEQELSPSLSRKLWGKPTKKWWISKGKVVQIPNIASVGKYTADEWAQIDWYAAEQGTQKLLDDLRFPESTALLLKEQSWADNPEVTSLIMFYELEFWLKQMILQVLNL